MKIEYDDGIPSITSNIMSLSTIVPEWVLMFNIDIAAFKTF